MSKTNINAEQLVAGALLKFNNVTSLDISLLTEDFLKKNPNICLNELKFDQLKKFISASDKGISLKDGLTVKTYITENKSTLEKKLEQIAGSCIRKYFNSLDLEEFMLRKIKQCGSIKDSDINKIFCMKQQEELKRLKGKKYVETKWQKDSIYNDYKDLSLSRLGELELFKKDYSKEFEKFVELLKTMRYDTDLLDDFLMKQNFNSPIESILNLSELEDFCKVYDRALLENGAFPVHFTRLESSKSTILDTEGKETMKNMLEVWDNHCIHICHPNHLFAGAKPISRDIREIVNINWEDIDIAKMKRIKDYKTFLSPDINDAFSYVHNHLGQQIMNEINKGNKDKAVSYLAIVEEYDYDLEDNYLVRGIIRGDAEGYSVAFNPEYQKAIPQSIWEKALRMGDHEVPQVYLVKRKK